MRARSIGKLREDDWRESGLADPRFPVEAGSYGQRHESSSCRGRGGHRRHLRAEGHRRGQRACTRVRPGHHRTRRRVRGRPDFKARGESGASSKPSAAGSCPSNRPLTKPRHWRPETKALRTSFARRKWVRQPWIRRQARLGTTVGRLFVTGRATGRTPASRHRRQPRATRHACAVAQTGASACAWCSPGSDALRFLTAVRLPLAAAGCEHSRWIATVESRDAVLLVAPVRLSVACPGPSGCCYSRRQQQGQALVSSHLRRLLGLAHTAARNGSTVGRAVGPVARILNPSPNATNGTVCYEAGGGGYWF